MLEYLKELFSESSKSSITRVLAAMCYITANIIAFYSVYTNKNSLALITVLLSTATTLKLVQKSME